MGKLANERYRMTFADGVSVVSGAMHDDASALREARIAVCEILRDELQEGCCPLTITISVTASSGRHVGKVSVTGSAEQAPSSLQSISKTESHHYMSDPAAYRGRAPVTHDFSPDQFG